MQRILKSKESGLPLAGIDVAVLVGGQGTRLRGVVTDVPKPLAPVLGRPFLFYVLDLLALRGARSVVLCCGYRAEQVRSTVETSWLGMPVHFSVESEPLGTGGCLRAARDFLKSEYVAVMNGDSWLEPDWPSLIHAAGPGIRAALALVKVDDAGRFGTVECEGDRVVGFHEKSGSSSPGMINAGVYLLALEMLNSLPVSPSSLERDAFPVLAGQGEVVGIVSESAFLDIGVPESYAAAGEFFGHRGLTPLKMFPDKAPAGDIQVKFGTCAVVLDEAGRVLLERRCDCGWWCLPGGRLDPGETVAAGTIREVFEETGLQVEITRFVGVFSDPRRRIVCYPDNGDLRHIVDAAILARPLGGELRPSSESLDLKWFPPAEIPSATVPPVIEVIRAALSGGSDALLV